MALVATTVMFTDLVGSTELTSSLGPAAADDLRKAHFSVLRAAIETAGGRQIKNLGDGVMAVFPSGSSAFDAAVEIQHSVARSNRHAGPQLAVRIGVSAGDASEENGDYFGTPVVQAARLCGTADGGQILATEIV